MTAPAHRDLASETLGFFCRHLVGLCVTIDNRRAAPEQPPIFKAYAGTLIEIDGTTFYLTAGHILREIEECLASERVELINAKLVDTFGLTPICDQPIPFDLPSADRFFIDDDDDGLDFGVIRLHPHYVRLLQANGLIALDEQRWIHQNRVQFDMYTMVGFPEEFTSARLNSAGNGELSATMIGVRPVTELPADDRQTRHRRFVGQITPGLPLKNLRGMSGGPIFGFKFGPQTFYWVVALQSTWRQRDGIVYGCPVPQVASMLRERFRK